jgi:hypothetical protein
MVFPLQHLLHEHASILRWYIHCLSCLFFPSVSYQSYKKKLDLIPLLTSVLCQLVFPFNSILYARVLTFLSSLTLLTMSSFVGPHIHIHIYVVIDKKKIYFNRLTWSQITEVWCAVFVVRNLVTQKELKFCCVRFHIGYLLGDHEYIRRETAQIMWFIIACTGRLCIDRSL